MCVWVDAHHTPELKGASVPAPIEIEAPWIGIDLHRDAVLGARFEDSFDIDFIAWTAQQLPAGQVPEDRCTWMGYSTQNSLRLLTRIHPEPAVDARHHEIKRRRRDNRASRLEGYLNSML